MPAGSAKLPSLPGYSSYLFENILEKLTCCLFQLQYKNTIVEPLLMATPDERLVLRVPNLQLKNRGVWYTSFVPSLCMYDYTYEFEGEDETSIRIIPDPLFFNRGCKSNVQKSLICYHLSVTYNGNHSESQMLSINTN